jgi:flagellar biogenesis protein FliO
MGIAPLASLLLVFGLLAGVLWWLRRLGIAVPAGRAAGGERARLEAVARLALGPHHNLHLVRVDGRLVLVACSPSGCALIHGWENADAARATGAARSTSEAGDSQPVGARRGRR